ncbi:radical SAM protein [Fusibacter sp. 3D3]|uniref:radical SAM protein n=1 Tax=Fusibacter sp. 3D3 TaxID=1048380 RepID=UPI000853B658|nr:radical SAM protein [Fusibacter sp. 3D3]GAU78509.1 oxygen-independent coproporphyrinogen III oxidase [Fusibacter sp. 3D3]
MRYEGTVYRPPSESDSLILQVTIGCAYNKCTFCSMYKDKQFRMRSENEIFEDIEVARKMYPYVDKFFLADGNALVMPTEKLSRIIEKIKTHFPECKRIGIYGSSSDILLKSSEDLKYLKHLGVGIIYMGIESGSDQVLSLVKKGATANQIIEAGQKIMSQGILLSTMIISGLGGEPLWEEHALESARVINAIDPDYIGLLTLLVDPHAPLADEIDQGKFEVLKPINVLRETLLLVQNIDVSHALFRSNHASNYVALRGVFPEDQTRVLGQIERAIECYRDEDLSDHNRRL